MKYNICAVTGSRSDFGILRPILNKFLANKKFNLELIITGSHASQRFGYTLNEIKKNNFKLKNIIKIIGREDNDISIIKQTSSLLKNIAMKLKILKPTCILLLGDRFEIFSAAYSAFLLNIPIIHIHGGEQTIGSLDNALRHSITHMSDMHFVSTNEYFKRILNFGIDKKKIFNVGSLAVESIKKSKFINKTNLEKKIKFKFKEKNFIITLHPTTKEGIKINNQIKELLIGLKKFKNIGKIFTVPSNDIGYQIFLKEIKKFIKKDKNSILIKSLGFDNYISCLKHVDGVIGNSSSGIIEVPSFNIGTVNIGKRQYGRIKAPSVIDVDFDSKKIRESIDKILSLKFKKKIMKTQNPYFKKNTSNIIFKKIKSFCQHNSRGL